MVLIYQITGVTSGSKVVSLAAAGVPPSSDRVERENFVKQIFELWNKEEIDAAIDLAEKRLKTNPNDALAHYILGKSYRLMLLSDLAPLTIAEYQKAAQLEPNNELYKIEALVADAFSENVDVGRLSQIVSQLSAMPETPLQLAALAFTSGLRDVVGGTNLQGKKTNFNLIEQKYLNRAVALLNNPALDRWYAGVAYSLISDTYFKSGGAAGMPDWRQKVEQYRYKTMELGIPRAAQNYFVIKISNLIMANQIDEALKVAKYALDNNCGYIFSIYVGVIGRKPNPQALLESEVRAYYQKVITNEPNNLKYRLSMADLLLAVAKKNYLQRNLAVGQKYAEEALKIVNEAKEILEKEQMDPKIFRKYGRVDLVEVYYYLGQVYEAMGKRDLAKKYYEDALNRPEQASLKKIVKTRLNNL